MIVEHLGQYRALGVDEQHELKDAYVVWLDFPTQGIGPQMPVIFECATCETDLDLTKYKAMGVLSEPTVRQMSVGCGTCGAIYHFDITPLADRAGLTWIHTFIK